MNMNKELKENDSFILPQLKNVNRYKNNRSNEYQINNKYDNNAYQSIPLKQNHALNTSL